MERGGQLFGAEFGFAAGILEREQAFEPLGLGLHEGMVGAILLDLALDLAGYLPERRLVEIVTFLAHGDALGLTSIP